MYEKFVPEKGVALVVDDGRIKREG